MSFGSPVLGVQNVSFGVPVLGHCKHQRKTSPKESVLRTTRTENTVHLNAAPALSGIADLEDPLVHRTQVAQHRE